MTHAEVEVTCAGVDMRKSRLTYAEVVTQRNEGCMNEKDMGRTSLQATNREVDTRRNGMKLQDTNQEGWSDDKLFVEAQQIRCSVSEMKRDQRETKDQIVHIMLECTAEQLGDLHVLEENTKAAILNTGCARSVSGRHWLEAHIRSLNHRDRSDVKRRKGRPVFGFGNGRKYKSEELIILRR